MGVNALNLGFYFCAVLAVPFALMGLLFACLKEKAAVLVSGFNTLPKKERARYDQAGISRDVRNQCFLWSAIMLAGSVLSYALTPYMAVPAFLIWLVLFFRDVHLDARKAFEKYLIK